ncbi:MAG: hypothetical protein JWQ04_1873 [Pedosphaera sp.]|nr:hypothetical protein [Pedosphaera sp.]
MKQSRSLPRELLRGRAATTLETNLSTAECKARLTSSFSAGNQTAARWSGEDWTDPVEGKIRENNFELGIKRNRQRGRAGTARFFGQFVPTDEGTRIRGEVRSSVFDKILFVFLTAGVIAISGFTGWKTMHDHRGLPFLVIPLGMLTLWAMVLRNVWLSWCGEKTRIIEFLKYILKANETAHYRRR